MKRRFSFAEVALARRIKENEDRENWERSCGPGRQGSIEEQLRRIVDAPLQPSYGPTPPWWEQAVAEADQNLIWVKGGGWMKKDLWDDILTVSRDMEFLRKECEDD